MLARALVSIPIVEMHQKWMRWINRIASASGSGMVVVLVVGVVVGIVLGVVLVVGESM